MKGFQAPQPSQPTPPGLAGFGMMNNYQNINLGGPLPPGLMPGTNMGAYPFGQQMNSPLIDQLGGSSMSQDQLKLLLALQQQNSLNSAMKNQVPGFQGAPVGSLPGMASPTPSVSKPKTSSKASNLTEMTKIFLSSMKDLSGKGKTTGILKFFNENKSFGFFVSDADGKDVFFHYEDVKDLKITKDFLREAKNKYIVKFAFNVQVYYGKYNYSTKAVDIELLGIVDMRFLPQNELPLQN
jgi:hypothetical protein